MPPSTMADLLTAVQTDTSNVSADEAKLSADEAQLATDQTSVTTDTATLAADQGTFASALALSGPFAQVGTSSVCIYAPSAEAPGYTATMYPIGSSVPIPTSTPTPTPTPAPTSGS